MTVLYPKLKLKGKREHVHYDLQWLTWCHNRKAVNAYGERWGWKWGSWVRAQTGCQTHEPEAWIMPGICFPSALEGPPAGDCKAQWWKTWLAHPVWSSALAAAPCLENSAVSIPFRSYQYMQAADSNGNGDKVFLGRERPKRYSLPQDQPGPF